MKTQDIKTSINKVGSLTIVGSGFQAVRHLTLESKKVIEESEKVLYIVYDPVTELWIQKLNPNSESMMRFYTGGKYRNKTYTEMIEHTLQYVRQGLAVCVIYYGHPGVFVNPSHESIKRARSEGFDARMLPGISAEDCLIADLGIDPGPRGCQSFEATDFLLHRRKFDISSPLILWQIGVVGDFTFNPNRDYRPTINILAGFLEKYYGPDHNVYIYQASEYVICKPIIQSLSINELSTQGSINYASTLYVPPVSSEIKFDYNMARKLGIYEQAKPMDFHFSIKKFFHLKQKK